MKRKLLAFLVCLCLMDLNLLGQARVSTISGIVSDFTTNQPLADVNVYFLNRQTGTITQSNGSFSIRIKSVPTVLFFSHIGFEVQQVAIDSIPDILRNVLLNCSSKSSKL